mmetsp:Transcript_10662/g.17459  ORF Transcript_10662/g.17459 Transcript_10662/m.17459 type:complete len:321 (+) Transcript_10662:128-1090(+)|eukprot:CAMPEP_0184672026 /NCGR_PEP_ID=MMETSP0308-20130426/85851_1 /TAXON_ID=38269 /ORGANISM="Gloeochaete witrockiana, Strain SAG 46.84" /LENGTH=320 /DNA_ID=CAMNT_0027119275 /DNA_START=114 /DNA_END=1076 /DNA_ORIENTATION=-
MVVTAKSSDQAMNDADEKHDSEDPYEEQISVLKQEIETINNGSHQEYQKQCKTLERQRDDKISAADHHRQYVIRTASSLFESEKKQAEEELEAERQNTKQRLLSGVQDRMKKIEDEKHAHAQLLEELNDNRSAMHRKLRKRTVDKILQPAESSHPLAHTSKEPAGKFRKKELSSLPRPFFINYNLSLNEINDDLAAIQSLLEENGLTKKEPPPLPSSGGSATINGTASRNDVYVDRTQLFVSGQIFEKGQAVIVETKSSANGSGRNTGVIHTMTTTEVVIKRTNTVGKFRVYLADIRKGKCIITKSEQQQSPPAANGSAR